MAFLPPRRPVATPLHPPPPPPTAKPAASKLPQPVAVSGKVGSPTEWLLQKWSLVLEEAWDKQRQDAILQRWKGLDLDRILANEATNRDYRQSLSKIFEPLTQGEKSTKEAYVKKFLTKFTSGFKSGNSRDIDAWAVEQTAAEKLRPEFIRDAGVFREGQQMDFRTKLGSDIKQNATNIRAPKTNVFVPTAGFGHFVANRTLQEVAEAGCEDEDGFDPGCVDRFFEYSKNLIRFIEDNYMLDQLKKYNDGFLGYDTQPTNFFHSRLALASVELDDRNREQVLRNLLRDYETDQQDKIDSVKSKKGQPQPSRASAKLPETSPPTLRRAQIATEMEFGSFTSKCGRRKSCRLLRQSHH